MSANARRQRHEVTLAKQYGSIAFHAEERGDFAAVHESEFGPSRHIAVPREFGRFRREADINWKARSAGSVANDPKATSRSFQPRRVEV